MEALRRAPVLTITGLLFLVQFFLIYHALNYGILRGLLPWDDCSFVLRALKNFDTLAQAESPLEMLRRVRELRVHAPLADAQAMLGLLVAGGQPLGPFFLSWLLVLPVFLAAGTGTNGKSGALFAAVVVFLLVQPLTLNALVVIKSDWEGGLFIAAAILLLHHAVVRGDGRLKMIGAGFLGMSALSKLTAVYLPLFMLITFAMFEFIYHIVWYGWPVDLKISKVNHSDVELSRRWTVALSCVALAVGPYAAFFAVYARRTIHYIQHALRDVWSDGLTLVERAVFYSPFSGEGAAAWGSLPIYFLIFSACCTVLAILRRDLIYLMSLVAVLLLTGLFLSPLAVAGTSNISFGATMIGVIMGGTLIGMHTLARSLPRWGGRLTLLIAIALAVPSNLPIGSSVYGTRPSSPPTSELRRLATVYVEIVGTMSDIVGYSREDNPLVLVFYESLFAPFPNLAILYHQKRRELITVDRIDDISDTEFVRQRVAESDFALTIASSGGAVGDVSGLSRLFPTSRDPDEADRLMARQTDFERVQSWPIPGGEIRLYGRTRPTAAPHAERAESFAHREKIS